MGAIGLISRDMTPREVILFHLESQRFLDIYHSRCNRINFEDYDSLWNSTGVALHKFWLFKVQ